MYITYAQLVGMLHNLNAMYASTPRYNLVQRFRLSIMTSTVIGMLSWLNDHAHTVCRAENYQDSDPRSN